ncbi:MAG: transglycosylase SLT domain-containing protein [Anaerolineales bacterium]
MGVDRRSAFIFMFAFALVTLAAFALYFGLRDTLREPDALYQEALEASPARAERLYDRIAQDLPEISEYADLWAAKLELSSDDEEVRSKAVEGLQSIAAFYPLSPAAFLADIELARFYSLSSPYQAQIAYRAALDLMDDPALRLELARYLESQGDLEGAYLEYRALLGGKPDSFADMRRVAADPLRLARDLNEATFYSDALESLEGFDDPEARLLQAAAYFGLERYPEAEEAYRAVLDGSPDDEAARLGLAKVLAVTGRADEAREVFEEIGSSDSQLELARLLEGQDPESALDYYLASPYPVAWWNATWLLEESGDLEGALPVYQRIAEAGVYFSDDAAYRLYILGKRLGDDEAVDTALALLEDMVPNWLDMRASGSGEPGFILDNELEPAGEALLQKVQALDTLGRQDLSELELLFGARQIPDPAVKLRYLDELSSRGKELEARRIAADYLVGNPRAVRRFWQINYPQPYSEIVEAAAGKYGLDPLLIWAIMRAESDYDPGALSLAGARGLMQLMPATQEWVSEQLGRETQPGDAYTPEQSVEMGAWFLDYLLDYFQGDLELAILAYNAGVASVESWLEDPLVGDREDLIRWIWFGETREYLERVSLAYRIYQELYP